MAVTIARRPFTEKGARRPDLAKKYGKHYWLVPTEPEALLYEKRNDGSYKLTGVEYIVASAERPTLYGQEFDETNLARYGNPGATVWTLHVWVWKPNPDPGRGIFAPWNTRVTCN